MSAATDTETDDDGYRWWSFSTQQGGELTYGYGTEQEARRFAKRWEKELERRNPDAYVSYEETDDEKVERLDANAPSEGCNLADELNEIAFNEAE